MFNWIVLDVAIGLLFIFLLYGLLATVFQELLANLFGFRAKMLERAICRMLQDQPLDKGRNGQLKGMFRGSSHLISKKQLLHRFYQHPLVVSLGLDNFKRPSYLTSDVFAGVLINLLSESEKGSSLSEKISETLASAEEKGLIDTQTLELLRNFWNDTNRDVAAFRKKLENWFDETQVRCTGWYKKNTQVMLFGIGLLIAVCFNVDTFSIVGKLHKDPKLREVVVAQASNFQKAHPHLLVDRQTALSNLAIAAPDSAIRDSMERELMHQFDSLMTREAYLLHEADSMVQHDVAKMNGLFGLGWKNIGSQHLAFFLPNASEKQPFNIRVKQFLQALGSWLSTFFGWFVTALAISLGAPFWFDLLNKIMQLRNSIGAPKIR